MIVQALIVTRGANPQHEIAAVGRPQPAARGPPRARPPPGPEPVALRPSAATPPPGVASRGDRGADRRSARVCSASQARCASRLLRELLGSSQPPRRPRWTNLLRNYARTPPQSLAVTPADLLLALPPESEPQEPASMDRTRRRFVAGWAVRDWLLLASIGGSKEEPRPAAIQPRPQRPTTAA